MSDLDFNQPDYEPLDGIAGFILPTSDWEKQDSALVVDTFGDKVYSDVSPSG